MTKQILKKGVEFVFIYTKKKKKKEISFSQQKGGTFI